MKITIYGQTPAQKNSKQIFYNKATGKPFITSNSIVKDWQKSALLQLRTIKERFTEPVRLSYHFYCKDNRGRDLDNMIASVNDILQSADNIIAGDNWQVLEIGSAKAEIDKENPRAEITILPL